MEPILADLGTFGFTFRSLGVHGFGISASSNFAVLYEASQQYLRNGPPLSKEQVARAALEFERRLADGAGLAADDVYPITMGGLNTVHTAPMNGRGKPVADGEVVVNNIEVDPHWFSRHVVMAFNPKAQRHDVPGLLGRLFRHRRRKEFVKRMSRLSLNCANAIKRQDIRALGRQIKEYVELYDLWSSGNYSSYSHDMGDKLKAGLKRKLCAWKPPGAGATQAIAAFVADEQAGSTAIEIFKREGWWATPAYITGGLSAEFIRSDGQVRFTAGHRLDLIGSADLGQDPKINTPGICCACAIEPRTELIIHAENES